MKNDSPDNPLARGPLTAAQRYYVDFTQDVLVYAVVLNLFVEFVDSIVIDSFTVPLLTAIVMKVMIDLINSLVQRTRDHFERKDGKAARVMLGVAVWS